jgi:diketogulonate reductase-like aldo/keto reductase
VTEEVVLHALQTGYRHVDSAIIYRNEKPSTAGLKKSGIAREELFFTTKIPPRQLSYDGAKQYIDESLKKTGLDYIDLYLLHAPFGGKEARIGAWKALVEAVEAGKIRSIGVSNYGVHHLEELAAWQKEQEAAGKNGGVLSVNQVELHPWLARSDIVKWCKAHGVLLEAYSPLIQAKRMDEPILKELAKKHKKTEAQILLRWSLQMVSLSHFR